MKFVAKLGICKEVLLEWITRKPTIYHQASDIFLDYIADQWSKPFKDGKVEENEEDSDSSELADDVNVGFNSQLLIGHQNLTI